MESQSKGNTMTITRLGTILTITGALLLAAGGCADREFNDGPEIPADKDQDGDGYAKQPYGEDCDDDDDQIYPGATETQNCLDDDCDGEVDEGTPNEDKDGDGYCPSTGDIGDCEGNPNRHPGMPEDGGDGSKKPNNIDDDCNGVVDDGLPDSDVDQDGFTLADGDCNDRDKYINPGAIEVEGMRCKQNTDCPGGKCYSGYCRCVKLTDCSTGDACISDVQCSFVGERCIKGKCTGTYQCADAVKGMGDPNLKVCRDKADNDCDKQIDELPTTCDDPSKLSQSDAYDYARAMELCDVDRSCGLDSKCPGKLKCVNNKCRRVLSASFNPQGDASARAIAAQFAKSGPFTPKKGGSFVILSTGKAVYDPKKLCPQSGTAFTNSATDPDPKATDKKAYDYLHLALEILVPTNARSFDFDFHFFSTEYPEYVGTQFNDTFWVQLQSKKFNGNISFDKKGTPIRINNAFFSICDPSPSKPKTQSMCTKPSSLLTGTGYAKDCAMGGGTATGGSTDWLRTTSPVEPGETIKLVFSIFDKGDHILDSAVLIDNFRWSLTPASKPTTGPD